MNLKLVHSKIGQDVPKLRRSNPRYKAYVKYRASIISGSEQDIFTFSEWLRDEIIFENRYF